MAGVFYVSVPLLGTDLPEVTKVVFVHDRGDTSVIEMAASVVDATHARLDPWENGAFTTSVTAEDPAAAGADGTIVQAGFSWSKLNSCLSNAGICLAAVTGGSAGTIAGCAQQAFT